MPVKGNKELIKELTCVCDFGGLYKYYINMCTNVTIHICTGDFKKSIKDSARLTADIFKNQERHYLCFVQRSTCC